MQLIVSNSKATVKKKGFWTRRNVLDAVFILGFAITLFNAVYPLLLVRAKLTVLIDHVGFYHTNLNPSVTVDIFGNVVNDSPRSAAIIRFDVAFDYGVPYEPLGQSDSYGASLLPRSGQTNFTLSRTLVGQNNTTLTQTALRSIVVSVQYQDDTGFLVTTREYGFL